MLAISKGRESMLVSVVVLLPWLWFKTVADLWSLHMKASFPSLRYHL